jgi:UDP-N-acetylglucosamine 4-epimerase
MGYSNIALPKGSKILITGAAGFIGSNLLEALLNKGHKVRALDNFSTGKKENIKSFLNNPNFEFIEGDIKNIDTCRKAVEDIDYVLHQAALGSVPRSMEYPLIYEDNNIKGTSNIMEASKLAGVKRFVYASSSAVYGDSPTLPKVEGEEGILLSPYALTKKVNEEYGRLYTQIFGLECIGLRYFNVFGRRQDPESQYAAVIPKFIKILLDGNKVTIHGDGEQSRDFTYIENVIEANLKACIASKDACGQAYNIAVGERFTLNRMYDLMCKELNIRIAPDYIDERPGDIKHSLADISKAEKFLEYKPDYRFTEGFQKTLDWYKKTMGVKK